MITTLALLHAPSSLPELQRLIDHSSKVRDPKFTERFRRNNGLSYGTARNNQRAARTPAPAVGG